jgi:hypothetical protein
MPAVYEWTHDAPDVYSFGRTTAYAANVTDPTALVVHVPYADAGDELQVEVVAAAHADGRDPAAVCMVAVVAKTFAESVHDGDREIDGGGYADWPADASGDTGLLIRGRHTVSRAGLIRIRLLGRGTSDDVACGLMGPAHIVVTHTRHG